MMRVCRNERSGSLTAWWQAEECSQFAMWIDRYLSAVQQSLLPMFSVRHRQEAYTFLIAAIVGWRWAGYGLCHLPRSLEGILFTNCIGRDQRVRWGQRGRRSWLDLNSTSLRGFGRPRNPTPGQQLAKIMAPSEWINSINGSLSITFCAAFVLRAEVWRCAMFGVEPLQPLVQWRLSVL